MDILIIKPSSLGDIVHGLQFAESLRSSIDNARISWVSRELFAPLVQSCNTVNHTYVFHRKAHLSAFVKLIGEIRQTSFDWILDLQGLFRSGIICKCSRGKNKAGRSDAREFAGLFYPINVPLPATGPEPHALEILMEFKQLFGQQTKSLLPPLKFDTILSEANRETINNRKTKRLMIFPESRRKEKEWPFFQQLTDKLLKTHTDLQLVWVGTKFIKPEFQVDDFETYGQFLNLSGCTNINELPALIESSDLILANDSGPMHLAAALHKEVVALFGPTNPKRYGPWEQLHNVLEAPDSELEKLSVDHVTKFLNQKLANY